MKKLIRAGATDQTLDIFIQNSSSTTGAGLTGLAYNSASLTCYYRKGATGSATALTLATQTVGGAHSDGGFVEIDATNMPGMYRLDLSDTIVAAAGSVTLMLKGATNMAPVAIELQVVSFNPEDGVRLGLTALPNAAADAAGGLPISDAGGLDLDAKLANTNEVTAARMGALTDWINGGRLDLILDDILADTADMQPKLGTPAGASVSADIAAVAAALVVIDDFLDTEVAAILTDTGTDIPALIAALNNLSAAQVNAEVVDALNVDTYAQPGQGAPAATTTMRLMMAYLYKWARNKRDNDGSVNQFYNDDATTVDQKQTTASSGGTVTVGEMASGP